MNTPHQPSYMQCKRLRHCACVVAEKPEPINGIVLGPPGALTPKAATGRTKMYTLARANTHSTHSTQHIDAHAKRPSVATVSGHWHRHRVIVVAHTHTALRALALIDIGHSVSPSSSPIARGPVFHYFRWRCLCYALESRQIQFSIE